MDAEADADAQRDTSAVTRVTTPTKQGGGTAANQPAEPAGRCQDPQSTTAPSRQQPGPTVAKGGFKTKKIALARSTSARAQIGTWREEFGSQKAVLQTNCACCACRHRRLHPTAEKRHTQECRPQRVQKSNC